MSRRKITEEAEQAQDGAETDESSDDHERKQLTQRMPISLVNEVDNIATEYGMSRNDAINMMVRDWLKEQT